MVCYRDDCHWRFAVGVATITVQRAFPVRDLWSGLTLSIRNLPTFYAAAWLVSVTSVA